jgi:transposase-like protein
MLALMTSRRLLPTPDVVERYLRGSSLKDLAEDYGVAANTIRRCLTDAGVPLRQRGAPRREVNYDELVYCQQLYGSTRSMAIELNVSKSTVQRRLAEMAGVEP